jgi:hypothetical protein
MASTQHGTLEVATVELTRMIAPFGNAAKAASNGRIESLESLLDDIGLDEETLGPEYAAVVDTIEQLGTSWATIQQDVVTPIANEEIPEAKQIESAIGAIGDLFETLGELDDLNAPDLPDGAAVGEAVVDYMIVTYLERYHPRYFAICCLSDVIVNENAAEPTQVDLSRFPELVQNPKTIPTEVLGWGTENFKAFFVIYYLDLLLSNYAPTTLEESDVFSVPQDKEDDRELTTQLDAPFISTYLGNGASMLLGTKLVPVPAHGNKKLGLGLVPYADGQLNQTYELGGGWEFSTEIGAKIQDWALVAQPTGSGTDIGLKVLDGELPIDPSKMLPPDSEKASVSGLPDLHAEAELAYTGGTSGQTMLLGSPDSGGLYLNNVSVRTILDAADDGPSFAVELPVSMSLDVKPKGGFVTKVLPAEFGSDVDLTVGYGPEEGIYIDADVGFQFPISVHVEIGPITLTEIYLAFELKTDPEKGESPISITAAASGGVEIGPISGSVKRIGIEADVAFPEDNDGALGPVDLELGFKPPDGAGLSLDQGPISGGGYIEYDPENERYAGILDVQIGPVNVKLMGLLATELPDGSDGFSLLLSVFGEFPPVQLSFGFTLNGLGGVIGINRSMQTKPLSQAVRSGNLDSLLFPEDPVANAQRIISDLRTIYPPTRGQHVFGPMVRVGWGTPTTVRLDLGIVLQLPSVKVAILGKLAIAMPTLEMPDPAQLIRVNLDAVGIVDTERQLIAIDASMYDSRVMLWTMKGDMALRAGWGENTAFVLSIGGFNPRFEPPSSFPDLERLTVCLEIPGGKPSVQWQGYLAVTANTFQVGASFDAKFEAGPVKAKAWWSLDALFQFDPFMFVVDFEAGLLVRVKGFELGATLEGTIKGPSPVHINGKLTVKLPTPLPDPSPSVSITLGKDKGETELPPVDLLPTFGKELETPANWAAQLPEDGTTLVTLRDIDSGDDTVLAHPMGTLTVRQTVVPIGKAIERKGENRPRHVEYEFGISATKGSLPALDADVRERFAPAQYYDMSDAEKMNSPSFKRWAAGRTVDGELFSWGLTIDPEGSASEPGDNATTAVLEYDEADHDSELETAVEEAQEADASETDVSASPARGGYPGDVSRALANDGAVANAESRWRGERKFVPESFEEDADLASNVDADGPIEVGGGGAMFDEEAMLAQNTGSDFDWGEHE